MANKSINHDVVWSSASHVDGSTRHTETVKATNAMRAANKLYKALEGEGYGRADVTIHAVVPHGYGQQ